MAKIYTHILWFFIGVFLLAILAVGIELGDDSECSAGEGVYVSGGLWSCLDFDDILENVTINATSETNATLQDITDNGAVTNNSISVPTLHVFKTCLENTTDCIESWDEVNGSGLGVEVDTLQTVTDRGDTTTKNITARFLIGTKLLLGNRDYVAPISTTLIGSNTSDPISGLDFFLNHLNGQSKFQNRNSASSQIVMEIWGVRTSGSQFNQMKNSTGYLYSRALNKPKFNITIGTFTSGAIVFGNQNIYTGMINQNRELIFPFTYSDTVGATNRDLYIDNIGKIGYVSSSSKYKKNIKDYNKSESKLLDLKVKKYDRINSSITDEVGLIAEEVEAVFPDLVSYKQEEVYIQIGIDPDTGDPLYKVEFIPTTEPETVHYSKLCTYMLPYIQDLVQRVNSLELELENLKPK